MLFYAGSYRKEEDIGDFIYKKSSKFIKISVKKNLFEESKILKIIYCKNKN